MAGFCDTAGRTCMHVVVTRNFNIYSINEIIIQTCKYVFFPPLNKQALIRGKYAPKKSVRVRQI